MRSPLRMIFVCAVIAIVAIALPASLPTVQTGAWTPVWNLAEARAGAAAVLLPNGSVLVVGGLVDGQPTNSAEIFNPDGTFTSASAMSVPRAGHSAILLVTGEVLVTGGTTSGGGVTNSSELYDVLSQRWSSAPPMKEARTGHTAVQMLDGSALIIAGNNSHGPVSLVEQYSLVGEDFSSVGTLLHPRIDAAAASLGDGRVLVVGGAAVNADDDSAPTNLAEVFDPGTGASTSASPLAFARSAGTATALLDGRIAVVGGNDGTNDLASSEIYDPTSDSWSTIAGISPRSHHLAVLLPRNHGVLIAGGAPGAATEMLLPWANDNAGAFAALSASAGSHRNGFALAISNEGLLLAAGGDAGTAAEIYRFATLKTDKDDYAPGQTVTVTGTGWQPGEQVTLTLTEVPAIDSHPPITVTADAWGNISDSSFTPDEHDFQVRFFVVATGSQSQAQTSFTDGNVTLAVSGVGPGTTTNFQFTGYSDANCVTVANGQSWPKSQSITGNNSANMGLGNSNSVKVTIPSDPAGFAFSNWSGVGSGTARTSNCVQVPGGGGQNTVTITANFTATQASQTINFGPLSAKSYGDADFQVTATASSGLPVSFAVGVSDQCTISGSTVHITAAGSCIVTATQAGNSSFLPATPVAQAFSISKATLTVTPANASREYGDANPAFTGAIVGIKNGDAITASYASAATAASSVGTYPITATLSDPDSKLGNYNVTLNEGTLNVTAATLTITPANASREYGDANSAFTGAIVGIKNGDAITASYASLATAASEVGTYPITATLSDPDSKLSNYNVTLNEGTLTVTKAALTVTPANASREYGDANPAFTGTVVGIKNGDAITASYASLATATSSVGTYPITATLSDPDSKLGNYNVTLNEGTLTVTKATLTVTPANASREYGDANPAFTGAIAGIKNGDTITASYASLATAASAVGTYPITATLSDPDSKLGNYNVTLNEGTLTVTKAALTVKANDVTIVLHAAMPTLTGTITGIKNNDPISATYATSGTQNAVGTFTITPSVVDPNNLIGNYNVSIVAGTFKVTYLIGGMCAGDMGHQVLNPINAVLKDDVLHQSVFKRGSTVPTKFRVCDANGLSIGPSAVNGANIVTSYGVSGVLWTADGIPEGVLDSTTPDTNFRWDSTSQQWIFNTSTKGGAWQSQTYYFRIALNDGSFIDFHYALK